MKKNKGITMIALIITIIILLILAGVSIALLTGKNGLIKKAELAKQKSEESELEENATLGEYENKISEYINNRDTITLSKEEYNKLKNANTYSKDEIEIGTWIDGKKVYRKVLLNNTLTSIEKVGTWTNYYLANELSIETLVNGRFGRKDNNGIITDIISDVNVRYDSSTGYVQILKASTLNFSKYSAIIIEYTKTTD